MAMGGRMCKKMGTSTCYPMLTDHDAAKGDNDKCARPRAAPSTCAGVRGGETAPTSAPTSAADYSYSYESYEWSYSEPLSGGGYSLHLCLSLSVHSL